MHIGKWLLVKHEGVVQKGIVIKFYKEDLEIRLENDAIINRKFWEVRGIPFANEKE